MIDPDRGDEVGFHPMTMPRKTQVDLSMTPYYHCVNRCVRRAFLCGEDRFSGRNYEHRKGWIVNKIKALAEIFAIDVCAYAVMSNHYHVVLRVDAERAQAWTDQEVMDRWTELFKGPMLVEQWRQGELSTQGERQVAEGIINTWRNRLTDISWYMRCLNEAIARQANEEDECKGRFWEGRFKSQALLDETALLSCMMYVDLNPIRAGLSQTLDSSDYTSIQERIRIYAAKQAAQKQSKKLERSATATRLVPFAKHDRVSRKQAPIDYDLNDYFALIDWTGRAIRDDKKGAIPAHITPLLARLGINEDYWLVHIKHFGHRFPRVAGSLESIQRCAMHVGQQWMQGCAVARKTCVEPG
jgi:REP element-mobilizing transposase RayT